MAKKQQAGSVLARYLNPQTINQISAFELLPHKLVAGRMAGSHKSPFQGFSVEFAGHREYVPGDDLKHFDWKLFYRSGKSMIKQYDAETNMVVHFLLDISESMRFKSGWNGEWTKLDYAANLVCALSKIITANSDTVSLMTFDDTERDFLKPSNSPIQLIKIANLVDQSPPREKGRVGEIVTRFAERAGRRAIVFVLTDAMEPFDPEIREYDKELAPMRKGIQRLKFDNHEVVLFHIMDKEEIEFDLTGYIKFEGYENEGELLCQPQSLRQAYLDEINKFLSTLRSICEQNLGEYILCNTSVNPAETLTGYLTSRYNVVRR